MILREELAADYHMRFTMQPFFKNAKTTNDFKNASLEGENSSCGPRQGEGKGQDQAGTRALLVFV